jgi:hypothetical protein
MKSVLRANHETDPQYKIGGLWIPEPVVNDKGTNPAMVMAGLTMKNLHFFKKNRGFCPFDPLLRVKIFNNFCKLSLHFVKNMVKYTQS